MKRQWIIGLLIGVGALVLAGCAAAGDLTAARAGLEREVAAVAPTATEAQPSVEPQDYEIVTLLPVDAIPAIFEPEFVAGFEADDQYDPRELVLGVEVDGEARAYSIPFLSGHEIVNDTVGGHPIAVTW